MLGKSYKILTTSSSDGRKQRADELMGKLGLFFFLYFYKHTLSISRMRFLGWQKKVLSSLPVGDGHSERAIPVTQKLCVPGTARCRTKIPLLTQRC